MPLNLSSTAATLMNITDSTANPAFLNVAKEDNSNPLNFNTVAIVFLVCVGLIFCLRRPSPLTLLTKRCLSARMNSNDEQKEPTVYTSLLQHDPQKAIPQYMVPDSVPKSKKASWEEEYDGGSAVELTGFTIEDLKLDVNKAMQTCKKL